MRECAEFLAELGLGSGIAGESEESPCGRRRSRFMTLMCTRVVINTILALLVEPFLAHLLP